MDIMESTDTDPPFPPEGNGLFTFAIGGGEPESHFVAFTATGGVISQSLPEPSTIFLLGTGIVGLIARTLWKKHAVAA